MKTNGNIIDPSKAFPVFSNYVVLIVFLCGSRSLLSAVMLYSTVFSTKIKEGANQTEIAKLLKEDGYANTGLTFLWYVLFRSNRSFNIPQGYPGDLSPNDGRLEKRLAFFPIHKNTSSKLSDFISK